MSKFYFTIESPSAIQLQPVGTRSVKWLSTNSRTLIVFHAATSNGLQIMKDTCAGQVNQSSVLGADCVLTNNNENN